MSEEIVYLPCRIVGRELIANESYVDLEYDHFINYCSEVEHKTLRVDLNDFQTASDIIAENRYNFCPYCGKKLEGNRDE